MPWLRHDVLFTIRAPCCAELSSCGSSLCPPCETLGYSFGRVFLYAGCAWTSSEGEGGKVGESHELEGTVSAPGKLCPSQKMEHLSKIGSSHYASPRRN
jgi:hypothetical protein